MRAGDGLLIIAIALSVAGLAIDAVSGGALGAWFQNSLYTTLSPVGAGFMLVCRLAWPLLFLPLLIALWGRFAGLPAGLRGAVTGGIKAIETVTQSFGGAARWFALGLVLATAIIVIQRYVFGYASTKLQESVIYMHALLFLLASASTLLQGGHVRVDIFYAKASDRLKAWIELWGVYLALLPMSALILATSSRYVGGAWRILERSRESDGLPLVFLLKTAIPLFAVLMIIQGVSMVLRSALILSGEDEPARPAAPGQEV